MSITKGMRKLYKKREREMVDLNLEASYHKPESYVSKPPKNTLSAQENFKLWSWLQSNSQTFLKDNSWTMDKIAIKAAEDLKFPITGFNIRQAFKVVGLPIPRKMGTKGARTRGRIHILAKSLHTLMKNLGAAVPPELDLLLKDLEK